MMKALIVDGYNAVHKIPEIEVLLDESLEEARRAITEIAGEYKRRDGGIAEVFVVFDGRDEYRGQHLNRPNQIFSGTGQGDRKIVRMVHDKLKKYRVVVVSDDNYVGNSARAAGATLISVAKFIEKVSK